MKADSNVETNCYEEVAEVTIIREPISGSTDCSLSSDWCGCDHECWCHGDICSCDNCGIPY